MTDKLAIMEELDRLAPAPRPMREGDLLVSDVMERFGIGRQAAGTWLDMHIAAGRLIKVEAMNSVAGRRVKAYRKPEEA